MIEMGERKSIQKIELDMLIEMNKICKNNNLKYYLAYGTVLGVIRHKGFIPWDTDIDIVVDINDYEKFCDIVHRKLPEKYSLYSIKTNRSYESLKARIGLSGELHHRIHIDIYPVAGVPHSSIGRKTFSKIAYATYRAFFIKKVKPKINYRNNTRKKIMAYIAKLILLFIPSCLFVWIFNKLNTKFPVEESDILYNTCGCYGYKELIPKSYYGKPVYMFFEGYKFPIPEEWDKYLTHLYGDYMTPDKTI